MNRNILDIVTEINNLLYILLEFCRKAEQDEKINAITPIVKCLYEKSEKLYMDIQR